MLAEVHLHAEEAWRYWLSRRSNKSAISWEKFQKLRKVFVLPTPKIVHKL
jgi:RNA-directed DNA polymerase